MREPLKTHDQALAALGCSKAELDALIRRGDVAAYRIGGGRFDLNPSPGPWTAAPPQHRKSRPCEPSAIRFWAKVDKDGPVSSYRPGLGPCWVWLAAKNAGGYGQFRVSHPTRRLVFAHRFSYELEMGTIPEGLTIDHLCRTRCCVNPMHLEPVTPAENVRRGAGFAATQARQKFCKRGHPLSGENVHIRPGALNRRHCRICKREANREIRERQQSAGQHEGNE